MKVGDCIELFWLFKMFSIGQWGTVLIHAVHTILHIQYNSLILQNQNPSSKAQQKLKIPNDILTRNTINLACLPKPVSVLNATFDSTSAPSPYHKRTSEAPQPASQSPAHPTHLYSSYSILSSSSVSISLRRLLWLLFLVVEEFSLDAVGPWT